jgi:hypothetical protein
LTGELPIWCDDVVCDAAGPGEWGLAESPTDGQSLTPARDLQNPS